jgi:hypothetical protein
MNSNNFLSNNLTQTPINDGYKYETHSEFIKKLKPARFSNECVFCPSKNTVGLNDEGSFRVCLGCKKQFKAKFIHY